MRKRIAFITPIGEWWPKTLYRDLVSLLWKEYPEYEYQLISSAKDWILLHFWNTKYDLVISSVPFLWKPPRCRYVIQQHWLYRNDRWFTSIAKILNWLYPYNNIFSNIVLYPSDFLLSYYQSKHKNQQVILNFSTFPVKKNILSSLVEKDEIVLLTIFRADIYNKAIGILDIHKKLQTWKPTKKIIYKIAWFWKYYNEMKSKFDISKFDLNINIEWIWWLNKTQVMEEINKCDVFLYSTFYETFGIILLEALSLGKPILLNNYESYYGLYDDEFISKDDADFVGKLNKLILDQSYYQQYLEKWLDNSKKFDQKLILGQWYKIIHSQL